MQLGAVIKRRAESGPNRRAEQIPQGRARRRQHRVGKVVHLIGLQYAVSSIGQNAERPYVPIQRRRIVLVFETARLVQIALLRQIAVHRPQGARVDIDDIGGGIA